MKRLDFFTKKVNLLKRFSFFAVLLTALFVASCEDDDDVPEKENVPEIFTDIKLIFTNKADASDVVTARAQDPDGDGDADMTVIDEIVLDVDKTYVLTYEIWNKLTDPDTDLDAEILEEDHEHQFFYEFTNDIFANPAGNGNRDNRDDLINYLDKDDNGLVVGLETEWTTPAEAINGTFIANLQHQPDVKSATSTSASGATDFKLEFVLKIQK